LHKENGALQHRVAARRHAASSARDPQWWTAPPVPFRFCGQPKKFSIREFVASAMGDGGISFGRFRFDPVRRELSHAGVPVRLGSRALNILAVLAAAKGELVSKDELLARAWPGQIVEEHNLLVQVSALRKALDADATGESLVVTVPGRGYRLIGVTDASSGAPLRDRPSLAVLPFHNLSDDPQQEYFADGIVDDIITALSRNSALFVIARNSSFTYKGRAVDVTQVGRELAARYVVEGSVRKAGQRVRITAQPIDATTGAHLWADQFDGILDDIFELQDRVTASIVGAMSPKVEQAEIERARRKPTGNLDAYDYYLRGLASAHQMTPDRVSDALRLLTRASELDPDFAAPQGFVAFCYYVRKMNGWTIDRVEETDAATRHAWRAVELGKHDAAVLCFGGLALGYVAGELQDAAALIDRALALNPNLAIAWLASGLVRMFRGGEEDLAIEHLAHAMQLSPLDPFMHVMQATTAFAHFFAGRDDDAAAWAEKAFRLNPRWMGTLRIAAASHGLAGRREEARKMMARALELDPDMRVSNLRDRVGPFQRAEDYARYVDGLRKAGLPE
jgi:TolB-like protein